MSMLVVSKGKDAYGSTSERQEQTTSTANDQVAIYPTVLMFPHRHLQEQHCNCNVKA
jgi:hypothetical protein